MKLSFSAIVTILVCMFSTSAFAQVPKLLARCEEDSLSPSQAITRVNWFVENYFEDARAVAENDVGMSLDDNDTRTWWTTTCLKDALGHDAKRPKYPTFGLADLTNPQNYFAPPPTTTHPTVSDAMPNNYQVIGICTSSCYKPDGLVLFSFEEKGRNVFRNVAIADALEQKLNTVAALSDESTIENPILTPLPVDSYSRSVTPTEHEIYSMRTARGHKLEVTGNHPVVDATGTIREASTFRAGDALVRSNGELEMITSINVEKYYGRVYNVAPRTQSLKGNIVIANGFLSGSSWYQNDGVDHLNSKLFRLYIPAHVWR